MMDSEALAPYGAALRAYAEGAHDARLIIRRDDGFEAPLPMSVFFRSEDTFTPLERKALAACRGRVLDVGAGTGLHTIALRQRGFSVTAIDVNPVAVELMRTSGVEDARCVDVFRFGAGPFDTLLLLGHGIGMVGDLDGLRRFLSHARSLLAPEGLVLLHSLDVRRTTEPLHRAYHESNRREGKYIGTIGMQFVFGEMVGPMCAWLHVDPETLAREAGAAGWECRVLRMEEDGDFLAALHAAREERDT